MSAQSKKNLHSMFVKIFQVSADEEMGKLVDEFFNSKPFFQILACMISAWKAKHLDVTTMFTYSHANMPLVSRRLPDNPGELACVRLCMEIIKS